MSEGDKLIQKIEKFISQEDELMGMSDFDTREAAYHARDDRRALLRIAKERGTETRKAIRHRDECAAEVISQCKELLQLRAELDRMRPVYEMAKRVRDNWHEECWCDRTKNLIKCVACDLRGAIDNAEQGE